MAKKLLALFAFVILAGMAFLWYLGGRPEAGKPSASTDITFPLSSLSVSDKTALALVSQASEPTEPTPINPKAYTAKDIRVAKTDNKDVVTAYAAKVKAIMAVYETETLGKEIELALAVAEQGDTQAITELALTTKRYQVSVSELLALEVPKSAVTLHLNLINNLNRLAQGSEQISKIASEPMNALAAAQSQTRLIKPTMAAVGNLNIFFAAYGVTS